MDKIKYFYENKQTPVQWLKERLPSLFLNDSGHYRELFYEASEAEREQNMIILIEFQEYMYRRGYISEPLWDFEDITIKFLNNRNFMCAQSSENRCNEQCFTCSEDEKCDKEILKK